MLHIYRVQNCAYENLKIKSGNSAEEVSSVKFDDLGENILVLLKKSCTLQVYSCDKLGGYVPGRNGENRHYLSKHFKLGLPPGRELNLFIDKSWIFYDRENQKDIIITQQIHDRGDDKANFVKFEIRGRNEQLTQGQVSNPPPGTFAGRFEINNTKKSGRGGKYVGIAPRLCKGQDLSMMLGLIVVIFCFFLKKRSGTVLSL